MCVRIMWIDDTDTNTNITVRMIRPHLAAATAPETCAKRETRDTTYSCPVFYYTSLYKTVYGEYKYESPIFTQCTYVF